MSSRIRHPKYTKSQLELEQTGALLKSEQSKTEKLQDFLEHAESDVEQLTNQLEEQKDRISDLEAEKSASARQLTAAKTGETSPVLFEVYADALTRDTTKSDSP